jgi:hypothetical protein
MYEAALKVNISWFYMTSPERVDRQNISPRTIDLVIRGSPAVANTLVLVIFLRTAE